MDDILFRQVHPIWLDGGRPTSQAFRPTPKDNNILSVYLGCLLSAEQAYVHYTENLRFLSAGVWGLSYAEVEQENLTHRHLPVDQNPAHGGIDFSGHSKNQQEKISKKLKAKAVIRGRCFPT